VVKCKNCGLLFTNPRLSKEAIDSANEETFLPCDINKSKTANAASSFIRRHPALRKIWHQITGEYLSEMLERSRGKVLDLGCGFGDILEDLTRKGCDSFGVETNPPAVEACLKKGLKVSCTSLEEAHFPNDYFDTVILCHVIEHLPYPQEALKEIYRILKPGGLVLVYCPNAGSYLAEFFGKYWQGWAVPLHLYHFTGRTIKDLAGRAGFKISGIRTVTPEYLFLPSLNRSLLNNGGVKFWGPRTVRILKNAFFRLIIAFTFRITDLFFVGKGECLRVELKKT
ncbi:MAG: class I SAM-dependent methyltransferase, partial [Candidatus Omnitrophica bacterium]|nr:class I SAM-dependent methyltransferase [Candidatus Omnitrophota bacterium]